MTFAATDDLRHLPEDPAGRMRDSLFWQFALPEEALSVQCYLFLSSSGSCGWHVAVWGEGNQRIAYETGFERLPADANLDAVEVDGLHVEQPQPLRAASLALARPGLEVDLRFVGIHDPFSYRDNPDGLPRWFAINRYEQTGHITGSLRVGDRTLAIDALAHRDHSWGTRDWSAPTGWIWFVASTEDGRAVQGWSWEAAGQRGVAGYVLHDGRTVPIAAIDERPTFGVAGEPVALDATVRDTDGGTIEVRLVSYGTLRLPDERHGILVTESGCQAWIDGTPGAGQWENERTLVADA